jgi:hypothetical protein
MLVSDFSKFILPEVVGCPDPLLEQAVLQSAFKFCDETGAWDELSEVIPLESGVDQYELEYPTGAIALRVRDLWIDGFRVSPGQLSIANRSTSFDSANGFGIVTIRPTPTQAAVMQVRVVYAPLSTAKILPDMLLQRYEAAISSGVKSRLMLMNGVTWANPTLGTFHKQSFEAAITEARNESIHDRAGGCVYVKPRKFA